MNKKSLISKSLIIVILLFISLFASNASSVLVPDGGGGGGTTCASQGGMQCMSGSQGCINACKANGYATGYCDLNTNSQYSDCATNACCCLCSGVSCSASQCTDVNGGCINNGACGMWKSNSMGYCNNGVWKGASCQCLGGNCPASCQVAGYEGSCGSCEGYACIDGCNPGGRQWCYGPRTTPTPTTTFNIHVQDSSQKSLSNAYVLLSATFPGGGTIPWGGYTDANGNIAIAVPGDQLPIILWSVTLSGYVTQGGNGSPPSTVTMSQSTPTPTGPCSSLIGGTQCIARSDCCWSDYWQICRGTGESCCHDVACSRGSSFCNQCPNDALDYYQCQGNNVWSTNVFVGITDCVGKMIGDYCQSAPNKRCDSSCNCAVQSCVETFVYPGYEGPTIYCSLPGGVCQQGDGIQGVINVNSIPCPTTPVIQVSITGSGCSITDSFSAGRYVASGPGWWYEYSWTFPQIPTGCLGKTATLTLTSEGKSVSKTITLSSDPTKDNPPSLPNVGVWSPSPILSSDIITYIAHAVDDKGLSQIQILFADYKLGNTLSSYTVVKTCPVSGTSADCTYTTPTSYPEGSELCMIGSATDIKGQQNTGYDMGARKDRNCITVCNMPIDTDNGKNYDVQGNCTGPCGRPASDACIWEGPRGYCCGILPAPSDTSLNWSPQNISEDGTVTCCLMQGKFGGSCLDTRTVNCKNILSEGFVSGRTCGSELYDCSVEGKICQSGKCVSGSSVCTHANPTITISPSSQTGYHGQSLTYTANIKSNDNSACSASTFTLTNTCPSGWTCSLNKNSVTLSAGSTDSSTTITVTSPSSAASGTYSFGVTATSNSYTGTGSANYVIGGTTSLCSDGTAYGQCSSTKPKYCDIGNLINKCSQCSCSSGQSCNLTTETCYIPPGTGTTNQINFKPGWNMFSLPLSTTLTADSIRSQCGSQNKIWNYNPVSQLYEEAIQLLPGKGYWLKVGSACTVSVTGSNVQSFPGLKVGWNQVGTLSQIVTFSDVKGNCNVLSGPWKYNPVSLLYESSTTLDPGYGYWVKVPSDCELGYGGPPQPP